MGCGAFLTFFFKVFPKFSTGSLCHFYKAEKSIIFFFTRKNFKESMQRQFGFVNVLSPFFGHSRNNELLAVFNTPPVLITAESQAHASPSDGFEVGNCYMSKENFPASLIEWEDRAQSRGGLLKIRVTFAWAPLGSEPDNKPFG